MKRFAVGRSYKANGWALDPAFILSRSERLLCVESKGRQWFMRVDKDENGDEIAVDRTMPEGLSWHYTYKAQYEIPEEGK